MRFWDSSAVLPLLVEEEASAGRKAQFAEDPRMIVWWACRIECASALNRLRREGALDEPALTFALRNLETLSGGWFEVQPMDDLRARAMRLLRVHPLRAADSLQLAAALMATVEDPSKIRLLTADSRLREAAEREGFTVE